MIIEIVPIRTMSALCYKLQSSLNFDYILLMVFDMVNEKVDELKKLHLLVAAENTWQGAIDGFWPSSKWPLKIIGDFTENQLSQYKIRTEENVWKYLKGNENFEKCLTEKDPLVDKCKSMFHPNSHKYRTR